MKKQMIASFALLYGALFIYAQEPKGLDKVKNKRNHNRVVEVNEKIENQKKKISRDRKDGELTKEEAEAARQNLSEINKTKKEIRTSDDGHLSKKEQDELNKKLRQNRKEITN